MALNNNSARHGVQLRHTRIHTCVTRTVAIHVQVASAGLELAWRCHGEEGEEEMQQARLQE